MRTLGLGVAAVVVSWLIFLDPLCGCSPDRTHNLLRQRLVLAQQAADSAFAVDSTYPTTLPAAEGDDQAFVVRVVVATHTGWRAEARAAPESRGVCIIWTGDAAPTRPEEGLTVLPGQARCHGFNWPNQTRFQRWRDRNVWR